MNILAAIFCIILFSLTVPFTRIAALETSAESIILIRIIGASVVSLGFIFVDRWVPPRKAWFGIFCTATGSVIGFASFMSFAMREVPSSHAAVSLAAMPMVTAVYSVLRDRIHPGFKFWGFAILGTLLSCSFFFLGKVQEILIGDVLLMLAVLASAFGYIEGGRLSRVHGGRRVMSWAIVSTLPLTVPYAGFYFWSQPMEQISGSAITAMVYLALVSQSLGMFLWFKVLAIGPMEKIALVQLLQPFFTLLASIVFLHEDVGVWTWVIAGLVAVCVFGANREKAHAPA